MLMTNRGATSLASNLLIVIALLMMSIIFVVHYKFSIHVTTNHVCNSQALEATTKRPVPAILEIKSLEENITTTSKLCEWPPINLHGREPLNRQEFDIETLNKFYPFMSEGHFEPFNCIPQRKVAIIVPFRNRKTQLKIFLNNVIPRIFRQQQEFTIYVVEQTNGAPFNKGMMANIGYEQAMDDMDYDCIVIHDVDILPEDDRNYYTCGTDPIHMATLVERFGYKLPYVVNAGGVVAFTLEQYRLINGFSNKYFGWGGEDDDLYKRIKNKKLTLTRVNDYGHCGCIKHARAEKGSDRSKLLRSSHIFQDEDGLNNLNYTLIEKSRKQLYVWILADIDMNAVRKGVMGYSAKAKK